MPRFKRTTLKDLPTTKTFRSAKYIKGSPKLKNTIKNFKVRKTTRNNIQLKRLDGSTLLVPMSKKSRK